ncbi:MAG TPA: glycosyltransferase [Gaiellaceae bacterium]|nr:glycosyltransferase [Gaiellaceae bacterium]
MTASDLSVVVASVNGLPYVEECLASLATACPDAAVIVADSTDDETRRRLADRWPNVQLLSFDSAKTIPELRAAGIFAAQTPYVAVIEDHCVIRNGWAHSIVAAHRSGHSVVGGPIRNVAPRIRDWAAFLFEYSRYLEPAQGGATSDLPGMNVSYDTRARAAIDDLLRAGKWESWLHERLLHRGFELYRAPDAVIEHAKDFGIREFSGQRFHYARAYAAMRNPDLGVAKRVAYAIGSPLLVPLLLARIARNVFGRRTRRKELVLALPLLVLYCTATAVGEASGYLLGDRGSLLKVR